MLHTNQATSDDSTFSVQIRATTFECKNNHQTNMAPPQVARLSRVWFPSGGIAASSVEDAHSKMIRAGFLRQSHSGLFHMLPLGRRVQDKVEGLVASHMEQLLGKSCTFGRRRLDLHWDLHSTGLPP